MAQITLCTLNAKHIHASLGLRYLRANMGGLRPQTVIREFTLETWPIDIAERLLAERPRIIGIGVYIWNVERSQQLVALLKTLSPETVIVLGGPEVSHEWQGQQLVQQADYLLTGQADLAFARLCRQLLDGNPPAERVIHAEPPPLAQLQLPYDEYSDEDIAYRLIYVKASRGCPFRCQFCLSALDKSATPFQLPPLLEALDGLYRRGVRHFKFVDRTFNLNIKISRAILEFFLERLDERLFLHFEVIPDRLPQQLRELLGRFPDGSLQLEIGIQSLNPEVQQRIERRQDNARSFENLDWLRHQSHAHLHTDLIIGLPGESLESIADGFDRLCHLQPHEIQVGILKRLKGAPILQHEKGCELRFNPSPPFNLLSNSTLDFATMQRLTRFSRYWEMVGNSGRFAHSLPAILDQAPFDRFLVLSNWLYQTTGQVHRIALKRLFGLLYQGMLQPLGIAPELARQLLLADYQNSGIKGDPERLFNKKVAMTGTTSPAPVHTQRQRRHQVG